MKTAIYMAIATALAVLTLPAVGRGEIIRLKNGVELHGELTRFEPEVGITVERYDNGGVVRLRWEHIIDADVRAIKAAHGYSDMEAEAIMVRAKKLLLATGDFVIGVQVESTRPGVVTLHRHGKDYDYLHNQVKGIETVDVEAQEVYTAEELYEQKLKEVFPETALDHFKFGVFCESIAYYVRALEHFQLAAELDPEFKPDLVALKIDQMGIKQSESTATEMLSTIKNRLYKKQFKRALVLCDSFVEDFPDSRQMGELEKLKAQILTKRSAYYQQKILSDYFSYMEPIAFKIATERTLELEDCMVYARDEMGLDIQKKLADIYGMEIEEIEELWANRKGGRARTVSYGTGTFVLGEEAKTLPEKNSGDAEGDEKKEQEKPSSLDERLKERLEKIKAEKAKLAKKRKTKLQIDDIGQSPEQWWRNAEIKTRKNFLTAYFAEKSGAVRVERVKFRNCHHCNGKGWLEYFSSGDEEDSREPCPVCKTLGIIRIVVFK